MGFPSWARRWAAASVCMCFAWYAFATGDLSFVFSRSFVSVCVFWVLLTSILSVSVGLLGDTWRAAKEHRSRLAPGEPMDPEFRREWLQVAARQLVVVLVLILASPFLHKWLFDGISTLAALAQRDLLEAGMDAMAPPSIAGWWGPLAAGATLLLYLLLWRTGALDRIRFAFGLYGSARFVLAMARMGYLRAFAPPTDFFEHVPGFRSAGTLALAGFLWADAPNAAAGAIGVGCLAIITSVNTVTSVLPPTWLFLSASDFRSFQVFRILRFEWAPSNGITLLNRSGKSHGAAYEAERAAIARSGAAGAMLAGLYNDPRRPRLWSIRVRDSNWEPVLLTLMRTLPLIVVDVRGESRHLVRELRTILHHGWVEKTILIGETAGDPAQLHEILRREGGERLGARIVTEAVLRDATWVGHRLVLPGFDVQLRP